MSRYKIGDKVRVLHTPYKGIKVGDVAHVIKVYGCSRFLYEIWTEGHPEVRPFAEEYLEPYTEPTTRTDTLTLTAALDATAVHAELDAIIAKLERIHELRAELGLVSGSTGA